MVVDWVECNLGENQWVFFFNDVKMNPNLVQFKENIKFYFNAQNDFHVLLYCQKYHC